MKFFDPKKKDPQPPSNPISSQKPANVQNPNPVTVSNPQPQPTPPVTPAPQPAASAPQQPKVSAVNPEPLKMEPPKPQEPIRSDMKTQPAPPAAVSSPPTIAMPSPVSEPVKAAPAPVAKVTGKTLIGNSVTIRGEITSEENLQIEGIVDGSIETNNDVIVGHEGRVNAAIRAANIVIQGRVVGDVTASNRVELAPSALLEGNIRAPKLSIAETARFKGSVDMRPKEAAPARDKDKEKEKEKSVTLETVEK